MQFKITESNISKSDVVERCTEEHLPFEVHFMDGNELATWVEPSYVASLLEAGYTVFCGDETADYCSKDGVVFDRVQNHANGEDLFSMIR